jgi:hypothetical protein
MCIAGHKPCSKMLRGLEVVKTNDIAQAHPVQLQPYSPLAGTYFHFLSLINGDSLGHHPVQQ